MVFENGPGWRRRIYSILLPFYPYTLFRHRCAEIELDSVIHTSTAGIPVARPA